MRILEGRDEIRVTCPECGSELGVTFDDVKGHDLSKPFVNCASCCQSFGIDIPRRWYIKIDPH